MFEQHKGRTLRNKEKLSAVCPLPSTFCITSKIILILNLDSSKLKEFADDNFRFDENGIKLSKWVENTVGKGEIACYKQFLLFSQCFQKACFPQVSKGVIVWEWVNSLPHNP